MENGKGKMPACRIGWEGVLIVRKAISNINECHTGFSLLYGLLSDSKCYYLGLQS